MKHLKHKNIIAIIFFLVECFAFFLFAKEAHFRLGRYVWLLIILFFALNAWKLQKDLLSLGEKKEPEAKKRSPGHPQKRKGYYSNPSAGLEGEPVLSAVTETVMKAHPHERSDQMVKLVIDRSGGSDGAEPLQFEFVLTDETTRKRIGNFIKHKYWNSGYRGLNLVYGVTDEDNTIFLSRCHSAGSNADGGRSDDYIVLTDRRAFLAHWNYIYYCESDSTPVRVEQGYERYLDLVGQAVDCYENYLKRRAFEEQCKNEHPGLDFKLTELVDQYRTQFENEIKEEKYRRLSECEKDNG